MSKRINYTVKDNELQALEQTIKHDPRAEVVHRATAIRLFHQGYSAAEIASMLSVSRSSVRNWHMRWRKGEIEGLADKPIQDAN